MNWDTNNDTPIENIKRAVEIMNKNSGGCFMANCGKTKITCSNCNKEMIADEIKICKDHDDVVCNNCRVICNKCRENTCNKCSFNGKCKSCQEEDKK
jgi:hypothetical protein